ncbi:MAG: type II secretion system F family protein [Methylococcales bacterium]|nr:type II secretion system F family protein [Methylococcales bacterium]
MTESFEDHRDVFPETVRHLTRIGEQSGALDRTLLDASTHLQRMVHLNQDVKKAMIYPAFVLITLLGASIFWISYVLPNVFDMFRQMNVKLPELTLMVMSGMNHINQHLILYVLVACLILLTLVLLFRRNGEVRYRLFQLAYYLPISRKLVRASSLAYISEYLSLLIGAGFNLLDSLDVLEHSIRNEVYRKRINQAKKGISRGNTLSQELRTAEVFPGLMIRLVSVGEQSGTLDQQLRYLAEEYRRRFDNLIASISEVVKPLIILVAGGLFILMIVVLLLPVYQLIGDVTTRY